MIGVSTSGRERARRMALTFGICAARYTGKPPSSILRSLRLMFFLHGLALGGDFRTLHGPDGIHNFKWRFAVLSVLGFEFLFKKFRHGDGRITLFGRNGKEFFGSARFWPVFRRKVPSAARKSCS